MDILSNYIKQQKWAQYLRSIFKLDSFAFLYCLFLCIFFFITKAVYKLYLPHDVTKGQKKNAAESKYS